MDFRWLYLAVALIVIALAAHMFRYEPIAQSSDMEMLWRAKLWDRWNHQVCLSAPGGKVVCRNDPKGTQ